MKQRKKEREWERRGTESAKKEGKEREGRKEGWESKTEGWREERMNPTLQSQYLHDLGSLPGEVFGS